jgi:hypothetical protein
MRRLRLIFALAPVAALTAVACGGRVEPLGPIYDQEDTGTIEGDSTVFDSGIDETFVTTDSAIVFDTMNDFDTGNPCEFGCFDSSPGFDTAPFDSGVIFFDTGVPPFETGTFDTGVPPFDSGSFDTGRFDTGIPPFDSGSFDTGVPPFDSGFDSGPRDSGFEAGQDGGVACGPAGACDPSTQVCCANPNTLSFTCIAKGAPCGGIPISCSSSASCGGEKCCLSFGGPQCQIACFGPQLCQSDGECTPPQRCRPAFGGFSLCR